MKRKSKRSLALLLTGALLAGFLPIGTGAKSQAAEQTTLRNPRFIKTTQEVPPGSGEKKELRNPTTENGITTWECIWFGNYWQEDTNGDGKADKNDKKTPIKWRVLSVEGDDVFLLADKNLDVQSYNDINTDVTWETCTMRSWLNGYGAEKNKEGKDYSDSGFLNNAFSADEQSAIQTVNVVNDDNPNHGTEGGNDTTDKVYLLSVGEVMNPEYGFTSLHDDTNTRLAVNTGYTAEGGETGVKHPSAGSADVWRLRSSGKDSNYASVVGNHGYADAYGSPVGYWNNAVRPALHLKLSSDSVWSYAGTVPSDDVTEWDSIWFGNYLQEDVNKDNRIDIFDAKQPIKWRVLSVDGDDAFLLADKNLDCRMYNDTFKKVTWETCTMRSWLNGYGAEMNEDGKDYSKNNFLNNAFTAGEQSAIKITNVVNNANSNYGTKGGNDTSEKVYLLSIDEVTNPEYGFNSSSSDYAKSRRGVNTTFAKEQGARPSTSVGSARYGRWWLRSPGSSSCDASGVFSDGCVHVYGDNVDHNGAVRPALHLNLSSDSGWSYAGTVTSDGGGEEIGTLTPIVSPSPTEPGKTQKPQETVEPGKTFQPGTTERPSITPTEPGKTAEPEAAEKTSVPPTTPLSSQKPLETAAPGTPFQPGAPSVIPSVSQPVSSATPAPGITSDPGKAGIGKVSVLKLKQKKGTVTVSWKKTIGAKGYQICYSTSKKWKNKKQKLVTKNKAVIKNLKKKKTCYLRVRAYILEGTKKVYGAWSSVKKIKIKK